MKRKNGMVQITLTNQQAWFVYYAMMFFHFYSVEHRSAYSVNESRNIYQHNLMRAANQIRSKILDVVL